MPTAVCIVKADGYIIFYSLTFNGISQAMLWFKAFHIISMVAWFAAVFYLPRLFVYHAESQDAVSLARFKVMERRLYRGIMWPAGVLTTVFGSIVFSNAWSYYGRAPWMHAKLFLVFLLWGFHLYCGRIVAQFREDGNTHSSRFYRCLNEVPTLLLIAIVILVVVKP